MSTSQNGYKSRDSSLVATYTIVRDVKLSLRKGAVSVVLAHFARWFDREIEPLIKGQCGGYNPRVIAGSKVDSNHASASAIDLNWQKHVQGKKNTFTAAQQKKIREQLKYYEGVIRWGGDYSNPDDMHFEINRPESDAVRIYKKIVADSKPKPPAKPAAPSKPVWQTDPLVVDGELGPKTIKRWQVVCHHQTVTDKMDVDFIKAIQGFLLRVNHRLAVDGIWGPNSTRALDKYLGSPADGVMDKRTVSALQRRLNQGKF